MEQIADFIQNTKDKKHGLISNIKDDFVGGFDNYQNDFLPKIKGFFHNTGAQAMDAMSSMMTPEGVIFAATAIMMLSMMAGGDKRKKRSAGQRTPQPLVVPSETAEKFAKVIEMLDQNDCISAAFCESAYSNPTSRGERETAILQALGIKLGGAMTWKESGVANSKFQYAEYVGYTSRQLNKADGCKKVFTKCPLPPKILLDMIEKKYNVCDALSGLKSPSS